MNLEIGKQLFKQKEYKKSEIFFLNQLKIVSNNIEIYFYLGQIYFEVNQFKKSIFYLKKALKINPKSRTLLLHIANTYFVTGEFLEAKYVYLKIIDLDKYNIKAYYGLYLLNPNYLNNDFYSNIEKIISYKKINLYESSLIEYLLSKREKNKNNIESEIKFLENHHNKIFNYNLNFNKQGKFYYDQVISKHFNKVNFYNSVNSKVKFENVTPIFIIGLPRSGSTLLESLLSFSNKDILNFGETAIINMSILNEIKKDIFSKDFNENIFKLNLNLENVKKKIIDSYENIFFNKISNLIFVDKSLENFFNIEIILKVFPNAIFIHTKRNYKDAVIAIYQSMLYLLPWAHKIEDIINYIDSYINVISYFEKKYSSNILSIQLEDLTEDQLNYSKKLFNFCNIKWNKEISEFYKKKNLAIKTLSNAQLRNEIVRYDYDKYKKYYFLFESYKKKYSWLN